MHLFLLVPEYQWKSDSKIVCLYLSNSFIVRKMLHLLSLIKFSNSSNHLRREGELWSKQMQHLN